MLHDQLLHAFTHDPGLRPRDVIVMVPDVAAYAPHIQAVFGRIPRGDARHIPFHVADHARGVEGLLSAGCEYLRLGSGALGMAYVAAGRFDGYWERHINSWDVAAGLALVREAGGWVSDFLSGAGLTEGREILGVTPDLLAPVRAATGFAERA